MYIHTPTVTPIAPTPPPTPQQDSLCYGMKISMPKVCWIANDIFWDFLLNQYVVIDLCTVHIKWLMLQVFFVFCFCRKAGDVTVQRFDKNLEEFYSICDQVELYLVGRTEKLLSNLCFDF